MDTKILRTIHEWLPWALENENEYSEYDILRKLGNYCAENIQLNEYEKVKQVVKIINLLYSGSSLHERNAIENEFLEVLAKSESPASLKDHIGLFPEKLKSAYLKTILEN